MDGAWCAPRVCRQCRSAFFALSPRTTYPIHSKLRIPSRGFRHYAIRWLPCWELERQTGDSGVHFLEMALVVQLTCTADGTAEVVRRVLDLRQRRALSENKRRFDQQERDA